MLVFSFWGLCPKTPPGLRPRNTLGDSVVAASITQLLKRPLFECCTWQQPLSTTLNVVDYTYSTLGDFLSYDAVGRYCSELVFVTLRQPLRHVLCWDFSTATRSPTPGELDCNGCRGSAVFNQNGSFGAFRRKFSIFNLFQSHTFSDYGKT